MLHPLLMPTILSAVLVYFAPFVVAPLPTIQNELFVLMILITTFLIPLLSVVAMRLTNVVDDYEIFMRRRRILPFSFITLFYAINTYFFSIKFNLNKILLVIYGGITLIVFLVTVITVYWKISAHSAGAAGVVGFLLGLNQKFPQSALLIPLLVMIVLCGLIMSSRLYLNSHKSSQVYMGAFLGFAVSYLSVYYFV